MSDHLPVQASMSARAVVIKGNGKPSDLPDDPDALRRIAAERHIAFHPAATVERMKRRLREG